MSSSVICPQCQTRLRVKSAPQPGQGCRCPRCGRAFTVPAEDIPSLDAVSLAPAFSVRTWLFLGGGIVTLLLLVAGGWLLLGGGQAKDETGQVANKGPEQVAPQQKKDDAPKKSDTPAPAKVDEATKKDEARDEEYLQHMVAGGTALNARKLDEALAAYQAALKARPKDAVATKKISEVQALLDAAAKSSEDQNAALVKKLKEQGKDALDKQQFATALDLFKLVLEKAPADADARKLLALAQEGLDNDQVEKKKLADFKKHLDAGKAALAAGRYADAIGEFVAAQLILPKNQEALFLQQQAENRLAALQKKEDRAEFDKLVEQGGAALRGAKFDEAAALFQKALTLFPKDKSALKGLDDAQKGLKNVQVEFDTYMARGAKALKDGRLRDAVDAYREARRLLPASEAAAKALRQAEAALESQSSYVSAMKRGAFAMQTEMYAEAVSAFTEALKIVPNDPVARAGLLDAQKGLEVEVRKKKEFDLKLQLATAASKKLNYAQAAKALNEALKLFPNHPQAAVIARQARYNDAMAEGTAAMNAKQFPDAIRAFQRALMEVPNDFAANAALTRARVLNGKQ